MHLAKKITALAMVSFALSVANARAESLAIQNCTWCHGSSAQGYTPAPRLAGQRTAYLEIQLASIRAHRRDTRFSRQYMWGAAANLSPQAARNLAIYFSALPAEPANDGDRELAARGKAIYQVGIPDANIVACAACHGPNAEGVRDIPRLGGLAYSYVKRRLEQWGEGYHGASALPMPQIAGNLSREQIESLASYLSFIK